MALLYRYQQRLQILVILVVLLISGCSSNPFKEAEDKDSFSHLYQGSSENKTANEAAIAAETPEEAIARGHEAYSKRQYDVALYEYVEALKLNGGDTETLNKVGDIHYTLEDYNSAAGAYSASIQLENENQHALLGLGLIQLRTRKYDQAKSNLTEALELEANTELWLAYNGLGTIADINGNYDAAIEYYRNALALNPNSAQILNNLGYSEYLSGNWDAAMMHYVQSVNADPDFDRAWYNIGLMYTRRGNYDDAFMAFRNVLDTPQAYNDIGYLSMLDGYYDIAEKYFQKAVKSSPSYYLKAHENLYRLKHLRKKGAVTQQARSPSRATTANQTTKQDDAQKAIIAVDAAGDPVVTIAPVSSKAVVDITSESNVIVAEKISSEIQDKPATETKSPQQSSLAGLSQATSSIEADKADTQTAVTDNTASITTPSTAVAESDKTVASISASDSNNKEATVSSEVEKKGTTSYVNQKGEQAEYREALAMVRDGQFEDAAESFNIFLDTYPESSYADNANYWIGETYYVSRDFEPALEMFTGLVENFPESPKVPDTRLKIGYIHYEQHDWSAAREELSSIVSTYPDTEVAQLANARIKRMEDEGH